MNRSADFNTPALREEFYKFLFEEDGMTDRDILAVFGSTERDPSGQPDLVARLTNAKFRYEQSIRTGNSPFDVASQAQVDGRQANHELTEHIANG